MTELLSIVVPAFNEERFVGTLLERVKRVDLSRLGVAKEIVVVDDHSTDRTPDIVAAIPDVILHRLPRNAGKGGAVRAGLERASGSLVMIQDADLEYDPQDYVPMVELLGITNADAVYGTRYLKPGRRGLRAWLQGKYDRQSWPAYLGGRGLSFVALAFTGRYLSDLPTALKLFRREALADLNLQTSGFELDHEITAKLLARGRTIREVPIQYFPRSREEGKKIGVRDFVRAIGTFHRYRHG